MTTPEALLNGLIGASILMILGWVHATKVRNASYVDVLWGIGVGVLGLCYLSTAPSNADTVRLIILKSMISIWTLRYTVHLLRRCLNKPEDARYAYFRNWMGKNQTWGFFLFFQIQASWIVMFASPFLILANNTTSIAAIDYAGVTLWVLSFIGLNIADYQLSHFKKQPGRTRKDVCDSGLWKYSRHPNYFFEWLLWCSYILLGWNAVHGTYLWLIPPIFLFFLLKLTGSPFVEARKLESRGENYRKYVETTSSFVPWFRKRATSQ
jgi:steroid 5-alpha reductase family enzyme